MKQEKGRETVTNYDTGGTAEAQVFISFAFNELEQK